MKRVKTITILTVSVPCRSSMSFYEKLIEVYGKKVAGFRPLSGFYEFLCKNYKGKEFITCVSVPCRGSMSFYCRVYTVWHYDICFRPLSGFYEFL